MSIWEPIINKLAQPNITVAYMAIGAGMGYYQQITDSNNQQYPCFLNKFDGNKVVILIDPHLEFPLKVESHFQSLNDELRTIQTIEYPKSEKNEFENKSPYIFRHLSNSSVDVFALNTSFDYQLYEGITDEQKFKTDGDIALMMNLISICLGKVKRTKLIVQDYTGGDISEFYVSLFNIFGKQEMLNDVLFDVTQKDGGCFIQIKPSLAQVDSDNNFIHEKFSKLTSFTESELYIPILKIRIDVLIFHILHNLHKLKESSGFKIEKPERFNLWFSIYDVEWDSDNKNPEYLKNKLEQLTKIMVEDIVDSKNRKSELKTHLINNISNKSVFINTIVPLKLS
jgi:hypothetical protein